MPYSLSTVSEVALFRATFEAAAVGIAHVAPSGRWLRVNNAMCEITGYSAPELLGGSFQQITYVDDLSLDLAQVERMLAGEIDRYVMDKRYVRKDGGIVWVSLTVTLVRSSGGEPDFFVAIIQDISERKALESARRESEERLVALRNDYAHLARVNEMGEMAAAIAHEINQPLTAIVNYLNAGLCVGRDLDGSKARKELLSLISVAADQALRGGEIVRRLREFVGKGPGQREIHRVSPLVEAAANLALIDAASRDIEITIDPGPADVRIAADGVQIQQILVNLIRNAVEALASVDAAARRLSIAARRVAANRQVEIRIIDTGPGIDPAVEKRLFQPFVTSKPAGMGIGLSVCRRLAEAHGGSVDLAPGSPGGAVATLTLPALPET